MNSLYREKKIFQENAEGQDFKKGSSRDLGMIKICINTILFHRLLQFKSLKRKIGFARKGGGVLPNNLEWTHFFWAFWENSSQKLRLSRKVQENQKDWGIQNKAVKNQQDEPPALTAFLKACPTKTLVSTPPLTFLSQNLPCSSNGYTQEQERRIASSSAIAKV